MATLTRDVYRGYKFTVQITGFDRAAFQKVTGLKSSVEVVDYREGNMPDRMEKLAGMMTYDTITLERGISYDDDFNAWMKSVGTASIESSQGGNGVPSQLGVGVDVGAGSYRKDVIIKLYDKQGTAVKEYKLIGAFPSEYTVGDFDATSNDVVINSLVLQHHGFIETNLVS
jgi:phage tail-like protein